MLFNRRHCSLDWESDIFPWTSPCQIKMRRDENLRGGIVANLVLTLLCLGFSQATVVLRGGGLAYLDKVPLNAQPLYVVRVSLAEGDGTTDGHDRKLSGGAVAGIVVGSIFGIASAASLICCLSRTKCSSSNEEKPGTTSGTDPHLNSSGLQSVCR